MSLEALREELTIAHETLAYPDEPLSAVNKIRLHERIERLLGEIEELEE